jgi:phenylacetate-CoA ligase
MSLTKSVYDILPPAFKNLAAGLRGHQLNWWRYGKNTERLVEEALKRESWSFEQWNQWREERLEFILERARKTVPYYREYWDARSDSHDWKDLSNWPALEKSALKKEGIRFLSDDSASWRMFEDNTSGTTGSPLKILKSRRTLQSEYALFEARVRRWHGVTRNDRWAIIGGQMVMPVSRRTSPFWVWNSPMNQLYLSAYHISEEIGRAHV